MTAPPATDDNAQHHTLPDTGRFPNKARLQADRKNVSLLLACQRRVTMVAGCTCLLGQPATSIVAQLRQRFSVWTSPVPQQVDGGRGPREFKDPSPLPPLPSTCCGTGDVAGKAALTAHLQQPWPLVHCSKMVTGLVRHQARTHCLQQHQDLGFSFSSCTSAYPLVQASTPLTQCLQQHQEDLRLSERATE